MTTETTETKLSKAEALKAASHFLRGTVPEQLAQADDHFDHDNELLLKFHGTYQQDDRDERGVGGLTEDGKKKKSYIFMVRTKIPSGKLTSQQLLDELDLCDQVGNATLRITSRQGLQLHGVLKENLKDSIRRINETQLSTLGACGDVNRNVMCCPAPYGTNAQKTVHALADQIAHHFAPKTKSYHELWLTDVGTGHKEQLNGAGSDGFDVEPIYGKFYMPRKFKMAIGFPHDNCVDVYTNDLGLLAITDGDCVTGYNVVVGGGFGVTPSNKKTFPALAKRLTYATPENVLQVIEAVFKVQRDYGNREDRKRARLKYVVHDWGIEKFKAKVEEYYGSSLPEPDPADVHGFNDHMGWEQQADGRWFYGLNIENGRIKDTDEMHLKTALRVICGELSPSIHLTAHQSLLFGGIAEAKRSRLESILVDHGVKLTNQISEVRRWSMACVAWPTCGLSITESERALPGMIDEMEAELARLGLEKEQFTVRMTGCPNGCARPYNSDIGLVGKARGKYTVFVGGRLLGDRLAFVFKDMVPEGEVVATLRPLFVYFKQDRQPGETFGDFCHRKGVEDLLAYAEAVPA